MSDLGDLPGKPKRSPGPSPTALTVKLYRERGYLCDVVERYEYRSQRRHDFLGMFDAIAFKVGESVGLQPTSDSNVAARVKKIRANPLYTSWLEAGGRIVVIGWKRGRKEPREVELTLATHSPLPEVA